MKRQVYGVLFIVGLSAILLSGCVSERKSGDTVHGPHLESGSMGYDPLLDVKIQAAVRTHSNSMER